MESKFFTLPSTPKLKKSNFSSSLISGATKFSSKINTSRIRISRPALARRINPEALERKTNPEAITPQQSSIENTLVETNKILVEIQKQLALDFAMRAREEKEERDTIRRGESRKKLKAEESLLEKSARKLGKGIKKTTDKIISPIKNVFDQILNFLTLVGAGIAANAAFEWLKDPENRKQLDEWFGWVADNWQWVAGITAGVLLLEPILSLVGAIGGAITIIRSGFDIFNLIRKRLFGGAKPSPGGRPLAGGKPTVGDPGKATGQRGGFRDPGRYRQPGQTRAGSSFQLEQAQKALRQGGGNITPKGNIFSKFLNRAKNAKVTPGSAQSMLLTYAASLLLGEVADKAMNFMSDKFMEGQVNAFNSASPDKQARIIQNMQNRIKIETEYQDSVAGKLDKYVLTLGGFLGPTNSEIQKQRYEEFLTRVGVEPRERGGPITAGKPYLVGEGGPELVVPKISGTVINNMKTEKIYQMISSDIGEGKINMMELPPITNQLPLPEIPVPSGPASEVPDISSINIADPYRILSPSLYGITV